MKQFWTRFSARARRVGMKVLHIWTLIFMTIAYFTVWAATAIILKIFGKNQLKGHNKHDESFWVDRPEMKHTIEEMKKQF